MSAALGNKDVNPYQIRQDFDHLAAIDEERWCHNAAYHGFILRQLPSSAVACLDVGCGTGAFASSAAAWFQSVTAVDLSS